MNGLREKFRNKKGFTLIEMLIVVAIIAILIAVSIPLVGSALEKARQATDAANERSAKAEITIAYLTGKYDGTNNITFDHPYAYNAVTGKLMEPATTGITGYGKCSTHCPSGTGHVVYVSVDKDGNVKMDWGEIAASHTINDAATLCSTTVQS